MTEPTFEDLHKYGWAPGGYTFSCRTCGAGPNLCGESAAKRTICCHSCAVKRWRVDQYIESVEACEACKTNPSVCSAHSGNERDNAQKVLDLYTEMHKRSTKIQCLKSELSGNESINLGTLEEANGIKLDMVCSLRIKENTPVIEDGFGGSWSKRCPECSNLTMRVMSPGKAQCEKCG